MKQMLLALLAITAACGGGSKQQPQTAAPQDPVPMEQPPAAKEEPPVQTPPDEAPTPDPAKVKADLRAAEELAYAKAKPVFDKWCAKCHTQTGRNKSPKKLEDLDITGYPFKGEHATAKDVRLVLAIGGGKASMPADKKGAVQGDELAAIAAWADAWDASHRGGAHDGHAGH